MCRQITTDVFAIICVAMGTYLLRASPSMTSVASIRMSTIKSDTHTQHHQQITTTTAHRSKQINDKHTASAIDIRLACYRIHSIKLTFSSSLRPHSLFSQNMNYGHLTALGERVHKILWIEISFITLCSIEFKSFILNFYRTIRVVQWYSTILRNILIK